MGATVSRRAVWRNGRNRFPPRQWAQFDFLPRLLAALRRRASFVWYNFNGRNRFRLILASIIWELELIDDGFDNCPFAQLSRS